MPRYFFDMWHDAAFVSDEEGAEYPDVIAAELEAAVVAAQLGRDVLPQLRNNAIIIEVRDESGQRVLTVTIGLQVVRHYPGQPLAVLNSEAGGPTPGGAKRRTIGRVRPKGLQ
jgi:hypothetical protein